MRTYRKLFLVSVMGMSLMLGLWGGVSVSAQDNMNYKEYVVTLDNGIVGTVVEPQADGPVPAVLMLHGFASVRDEVGNMYLNLAAALGDEGIASLRIDFRGWGESAGDMVDSTVQGQVEDAATAYNYLTTLPFVDTSRIGLIGFSLGGSIATFSAGEHPDWYQSMVLWSSGTDLPGIFLEELGQDNFDKAAADGQVTIDLGWREVTLGADFFTSLSQYDAEAEFANYHGNFFVVAGTEDFSADYLDWYLSHAQGSLRGAFLVPGADHIYLVLTDDPTLSNTVIAKTAEWFKMSL